jgi:hypothetical protein
MWLANLLRRLRGLGQQVRARKLHPGKLPDYTAPTQADFNREGGQVIVRNPVLMSLDRADNPRLVREETDCDVDVRDAAREGFFVAPPAAGLVLEALRFALGSLPFRVSWRTLQADCGGLAVGAVERRDADPKGTP